MNGLSNDIGNYAEIAKYPWRLGAQNKYINLFASAVIIQSSRALGHIVVVYLLILIIINSLKRAVFLLLTFPVNGPSGQLTKYTSLLQKGQQSEGFRPYEAFGSLICFCWNPELLRGNASSKDICSYTLDLLYYFLKLL